MIVILYGTETYNSYEFAMLLSKRLKENSYESQVYSMDEFELTKILSIRHLVMISSTYGNGDNPSNSVHFWKFLLQKKLPPNFLDHMRFTTFGLGDSSYPRYNYFIRKLHKRFLQLGATEFCIRAEADEQSHEGIEAFYKEWEQKLMESVQSEQIPKSAAVLKDENSFSVELETQKFKRKTDLDVDKISNSRAANGLLLGEVLCNKRLTSEDHFQDVRHFTIKPVSGILEYSPGDVVEIYPRNAIEDVNFLIEDQGWSDIADYKLITDYTQVQGGFVSPLTLRSLFVHHLDIMSVPRRSFFQKVYQFASNETQREKLKEFSELEFTEDLYNYANRPRRSILETILEFDSLKIPYKSILDVFPVLRPRQFSIASTCANNTIELCVATVQYKTIIKRVRKGVCTSWMRSWRPSDQIVLSLKRNTLHKKMMQNLSKDASTPMVLIGPGTGIAPVRAIVKDQIRERGTGAAAELHLFTGNRYRAKDYLYGEEFEKLASSSRNLHLYASFSRDADCDTKYVQDCLYKHAQLVYSLVFEQRGIVYLCGSSGKMPIQVRATLEQIVQDYGNFSADEAKKQLLLIEKSWRYLQETW